MHAVYEAVFRSQPDEHAFAIERVRGAIPSDLHGTLLRSGPGLMQLGDAYLNFFDGHALIAGVSFANGSARFRSRFVRTPLYEAETKRRTVLQRRPFSNRPQRWSNLFAIKFGNSAMHDVYAWGEGAARRVVAGNDFGHFALDPRTLATLGPETWQGAAPAGTELAPMPYRDPHSGRLIGWIKRPGAVKPDAISFVELDAEFRVAKQTPFLPLAAAPAIVHDQRATDRFYVATEQALRLQAAPALWGAVTAYEALIAPAGSTATLLVVPRENANALLRVALPAPVQIAFHVVNAFDSGEHVVVDLVTYDGRVGFEAAAPRAQRERSGHAPSDGPLPTLRRYVVDPRAARVVSERKLCELPGEAPEIADGFMGRPYAYAYLPTLGSAQPPDRGAFFYYGALAKHALERGTSEVWDAGLGAVVSPCAFVPRPAAASEDDGWLLSYVLRESSSELAVLDAQRLAAGPVATLELGVPLPGVSHVRWAADLQLQIA
ncbi:MAG TPA: carotenoid oxygenase family protein [Polyangiales bacterium]|nr:carotenoid oxygenase family protein [Polyangiales bacterium]